MSAIARASWVDGEAELRALPGYLPRRGTTVDIGVAHGVYTWHLMRRSARVVGFEANPEVAALAGRRNPGAQIHAIALSDAQDRKTLRIPVRGGVGLSGLASVEEGNTLEDFEDVRPIDVPCGTLDSFGLEDVVFIKIDVEGHELAVLRGAVETLRRCRPVIMIEVEDRHRAEAVASVRDWAEAEAYEMAPTRRTRCNYLLTPRDPPARDGAVAGGG